MGHALHLPLGERVGHGEADIDVAAFVGAQLRVEEGGLAEVGADLLGGGIGCATCGFLSGCHRRRSSLIVRCSNILNHIENYLSLFTSFKINTIVIASYPHTIHYRLGTIATVAAHGHHLSITIVASAGIRTEIQPVVKHSNGVVEIDAAVVVLAETSPPRKRSEFTASPVQRGEEAHTVIVTATYGIQSHVVHRTQQFGGYGFPFLVGQADLVLLQTARLGLVAEAQELETDVLLVVGDRDCA